MGGLDKALPTNDISMTPVIVSNHVCYLDGIILASVLGAPKIVAMSDSRKAPVLGSLMEEMEVVFVERGSKDSRQATMDAIVGHCDEWKPGARPLLIFPEGKTTNGESLVEFKKGAFAAGVPVRPVLIVYTGQWDPAACTYRQPPGSEGLVEVSQTEWAKQFMGHFVHSIHVRILAPYVPDDAERADPGIYAQNCQRHMANELERVKNELTQKSWKAAAGREAGGLGYRVGDMTRMTVRKI